MGGLKKVLNFIDWTNEYVGRYASLIMLPMLVIMVLEVFMRYVLKSPTIWGTELTTFLFAGYTLLGAGYTHLKSAHVNMNALYGAMSPRTQAIFDLITWCGFFLYCAVLLLESSRFFWDTFSSGRTTGSDWNPILWPVLLTLPLGTLLLLLQGIAKLIRDIIYLATGQREEPAP